MSSTIAPPGISSRGGDAPLPGQAYDVTLEDLDDVQLTKSSIRTPAILQSALPSLSMPSGPPQAWRKAAGGVADHKPSAAVPHSLQFITVLQYVILQLRPQVCTAWSHGRAQCRSSQVLRPTPQPLCIHLVVTIYHRSSKEAPIHWCVGC